MWPFSLLFCKLCIYKRSNCLVLPCFFGHWFLLVLWTPPWCSSAVHHAGGWNWSQCSSTPLDILLFHAVKYLSITLLIYLDFAKKPLKTPSSPSSDVVLLNSLLTSSPLLGFIKKRRDRGNKKKERMSAVSLPSAALIYSLSSLSFCQWLFNSAFSCSFPLSFCLFLNISPSAPLSFHSYPPVLL